MSRKLFKTFEYGTTPNTYDVLKAIAIFTMIIDHLGVFFFQETEPLRIIGRIAFPIFLFLVGYSNSFRFDRWLLIGGCIVALGAAFTSHAIFPLNILFSILFSRILLSWITKASFLEKDFFVIFIVLILFHPIIMLFIEYGSVAFMIALMGWVTRQGRKDLAVTGAWVLTFCAWICSQWMSFSFAPLEMTIFTIEAAVLFFLLNRIHIREIPILQKEETTSPNIAERIIILFARNSLVIYVLHIVCFQILERVLFPDRFEQLFVIMNF